MNNARATWKDAPFAETISSATCVHAIPANFPNEMAASCFRFRSSFTVTVSGEPWRSWTVNIDRRRTLQIWTNAKRAAANQDLPPEVRIGQESEDHAEMVLGMQDAAKRKAERDKKAI
jgi:hypothetical protein